MTLVKKIWTICFRYGQSRVFEYSVIIIGQVCQCGANTVLYSCRERYVKRSQTFSEDVMSISTCLGRRNVGIIDHMSCVHLQYVTFSILLGHETLRRVNVILLYVKKINSTAIIIIQIYENRS